MLEVMRFWLDKGVDGFRVDVISFMMKDAQLRDEPLDPDWDGVNPYNSLQHIYTQNLPEVHDIIKHMRAVLDEYDERMMVGEIFLPFPELMKYYGDALDECHLPFNFYLMAMGDFYKPTPWDAQTVRRIVYEYEAVLPEGAWPNWVLSNHDVPRAATRFGSVNARAANMMLLTLRGTPTVYYGEEIGMENVTIPPEFVQDPPAVNQPEIADKVGRDPERTPMQWDASPKAGFAAEGVIPWLPVAADYAERNVARQENDPTSMLSLYRALTTVRRAEPALYVGDYASVETKVEDVFAYTRTAPNADRFLIVLNFGGHTHTLDLSQVASKADIAVTTDMVRGGAVDLSELKLGSNEGVVLRLH
jgi:alpha-glucosidase